MAVKKEKRPTTARPKKTPSASSRTRHAEEPEPSTTQPTDTEERSYTKEDNRAALLRQIDEIEEAYLAKKISYKDKSAQQYAIRFRLQDKFDMDASGDERRVIVVPQKHDTVCPYTHRECSSMPSKEACMKYYNLIERPTDD